MAAEASDFIAELKRWRDVRGLSQTRLAQLMRYDRSYISKIETGQEWPAADFARRADEALGAGGAIVEGYASVQARPRAAAAGTDGEPASLVVELDDARLRYDDGIYHATMTRTITNHSPDPVTRYLIRISVDRYPADPQRSNEMYRHNPLSWDELNLRAFCGDQPMLWEVRHDRDAFKELWLLFENDGARFPLRPGESTQIQYAFSIKDEKWGDWFQRAIRLPTKRVVVRLDFPADTRPVVWGNETSMTTAPLPLRSPIQRVDGNDRARFTWSTDSPPLHARFRLEWSLHQPAQPAAPAQPSHTMAELGVVQEGSPILAIAAHSFTLPAEAAQARRILTELELALHRIARAHTFSKGMGIAAPQLGIAWSAAMVRTLDGSLISLLNPVIIEQSAETDVQYEGCLSFFDVRGKVERPLVIQVEHTTLDGQTHITEFRDGLARLVAHEVDHLNGVLYLDRMALGAKPIPVSRYQGSGQPWAYTGEGQE